MMARSRAAVAVAAPLAIFVAVGGLLYAGLRLDDSGGLPSSLIGHPAVLDIAPLGDMETPSAEDLALDQPKLVNFWASWCAPCRVEHANLMSMADSGIPIHGVNYKDDPENALEFLRELGNPFAKSGADPEGRAAIDWGVYGIPETFVVDGSGNIALRFAGPVTERVMRETILPAIADAEGS